VEVKLDGGAVQVRRRHQPLVSFEHPASLPLGDVLAQVDEACKRGKSKPWNVHVSLGGALCPVVPFTLPAGIKRWGETLAVARATVATAWGVPVEQADELDCTFDPRRKEAAALMAGTHQQIRSWAALHGGRLASLVPLMPERAAQKRARLQFVEPRAWKLIWLFTAIFLISLAGFTGWQVWQQHEVRRGLQMELDRLQAELKARSAPVVPVLNPREASEKAAQRLLQRDWNRLFDTIENPDLANVRLVQLTFDAETGEARLEYELENMTQGAKVTSVLNSTEGTNVWRLERLNADTGGATGAGKARGVWRARLL
jgi:hypothetical protein